MRKAEGAVIFKRPWQSVASVFGKPWQTVASVACKKWRVQAYSGNRGKQFPRFSCTARSGEETCGAGFDTLRSRRLHPLSKTALVPSPLTQLSEEEQLFYSTVRQFAD